jgi:hypothetical protein
MEVLYGMQKPSFWNNSMLLKKNTMYIFVLLFSI